LQSDNSLYYFLPATGVDFLSESPMVFLIVAMANWCKERNIQFLDLGISSVEGHLQQGLYDFKKRMGAKDSEKWTLEQSLE
jgi:lipid II:glycine glycyltransferase (peptidoglycan interpeptide bridge formation enzyme)